MCALKERSIWIFVDTGESTGERINNVEQRENVDRRNEERSG